MELNNPINIFAVQDNSNKISQTIIDHVIPVEDEYSVDFNVKKDEDKKVMIAMKNLSKCGSSIAVENALVHNIIMIPPILQVEESLLSLGSHGNVDGVFSITLFKF
ncbi:uncharacterized protein LOC136077956 isoform X1 [Hydra vulgaris]|uniref:Uncharacterized protein LOC136077956 isoform X1 n=1 Tax=Hydra vulgaris TaxID=6087 RepID=A0ABM4BHJ7_HYDVU